MIRTTQTNTTAFFYAGVPKEEIESYREVINQSIGENRPGGMGYRDFKLMPAFIKRANEKDKNLNAFFVQNGIKELTEKIKELKESGVTSARFVVNAGEKESVMSYHFAAFDYKAKLGEKASLIGIDPAIVPSKDVPPYLRSKAGSATMLDDLEETFRKEFPDTAVIFMEADIQKSGNDCGIFSLAFVKKMSQEKIAFDTIHQKNIGGQLGDDIRMECLQAYKLLPPSFLKHGHSRSTLASFRAMQREAQSESGKKGWQNFFSKDPMKQAVSKKRDSNGKKFTLESWQNARLVSRKVDYETKTFSQSIEFKRQKEIEKLLPK